MFEDSDGDNDVNDEVSGASVPDALAEDIIERRGRSRRCGGFARTDKI